MIKFSKILVVSFHQDKSEPILYEVKNILSKKGYDFFLYDENIGLDRDDFDLVLVIGGDGSMLSAAKNLAT